MELNQGNIDSALRMDSIRAAAYGVPTQILNNTYLLKFEINDRIGNGYAIKHESKKELIIIDAVSRDHWDELVRFRESGFIIKAILITKIQLVKEAYTELSDIARQLDTQVFIHPHDSMRTHSVDITGFHQEFSDFDLTILHTPGYSHGSIMVYSGKNKALFTGNAAYGCKYDLNKNHFQRPIIADIKDDLQLREGWKSLSVDFKHLLPLKGKPQFDLDEEQREQILMDLLRIDKTTT